MDDSSRNTAPPLSSSSNFSQISFTPSSLVLPTTPSFSTYDRPHRNGVVSPPPSQPHFRLVSVKSSPLPSSIYTSLRDVLPGQALCSPTVSSPAYSGYEISIRNRLVKQAAWAYLQPMSSSFDASDSPFLRRFWLEFSASSRNYFSSCVGFFRCGVIPAITRAFNWLIGAIRVCLVR